MEDKTQLFFDSSYTSSLNPKHKVSTMSNHLARRNRDLIPFLSHLCPSPCPRDCERPCIYSFMKIAAKLKSAKQRKREEFESQDNMKKKI